MTEDQVLEEQAALFSSWKNNKVTKLFYHKLSNAIEEMTQGLVWDKYDNPDLIKGYIRAYQNLLDLDMRGLFNND